MDEALYTQTGGSRIGRNSLIALNATWPLARIKIYKDRIIITGILGNTEILKSDIDSISNYGGRFFSRGIRIRHHKQTPLKFVVFWPISRKKLVDNIKKAGYNFIEI